MGRQSARQRLEEAYFDMLENTHYSKITVSDIIRKTEISRTTFYRHYVDIFDMHKKIADRLASNIIKECAVLVMKSHSEHDYFEEILKIFNTQEKYIILISGENGSRYFFESMLRNAQDVITCAHHCLTEDQIFRIRFMTVAMVGVYVRNILEGRQFNPEYIEICKKLLNHKEMLGGCHAKQG